MKKINSFILVITGVFLVTGFGSCGTKNQSKDTALSGETRDSSVAVNAAATKNTVEGENHETVTGNQMDESVDVPVFANWIHPVTHAIYDGKYDSLSQTICLCETKEVHHADSRDVKINVNGNCFDAGDIHPMMLTMKINSATVFGRLAAWDTVSGKIIFIGISNDTIITQTKKINPEALRKLKFKYFKSNPMIRIDKKIMPYFSNEKIMRNEEVKKRMILNNKNLVK
jgi:hypothetical protein